MRSIGTLPQYNVLAHGKLTPNLRAFTVPKNTAILHFTIPGYKTIAKILRNDDMQLFTPNQRAKLLRGDGRWQESSYAVMYVEGDTIPDVELEFRNSMSITGVTNVKKQKHLLKVNASSPQNGPIRSLSNVIHDYGPGVYFVVSCRHTPQNTTNYKHRLQELQRLNLKAHERFLHHNVSFYKEFVGRQYINDVLLGVRSTFKRACESRSPTFTFFKGIALLPITVLAILLIIIFSKLHGSIRLYASTRTMAKLKTAVQRLVNKKTKRVT